MADRIQLRRGIKSKLPTLTQGEPSYVTDTRELFIGTGSGNVNMGGSMWYKGTDMSGTSATTDAYSYSACPIVKVGDTYLNTSNGNVYECTTAGSGLGAKWTYKGNIKGAAGKDAVIDDALSTTSTNALQNKIATAMFYEIAKRCRKSFFTLNMIDVRFSSGYLYETQMADLYEGVIWYIPKATDWYDTIYTDPVGPGKGAKFDLDRAVQEGESAVIYFPSTQSGSKAYVIWRGTE